MKTRYKILAALLLVSAVSGSARADFIAYDIATGFVGNQNNFSGSIGLDFDVVAPIQIIGLGAFDSGSDGLQFDHRIQLYDRQTQQLISELVIPSGTSATLIGGNRFVNYSAPLNLGPGQYTIVGSGFVDNDAFYNAGNNGGAPGSTENDGGGAIVFVGSGRYGSANSFPVGIDNPATHPTNAYNAGTFSFISSVPEPGSMALMGLGLVGLVGVRNRRRRPARNAD